MIVALPNLERRMRWSDSKQAVQKSPMLARLRTCRKVCHPVAM